MYESSIYFDSMINDRRTAGLDRELERRRVAIERGTMNPSALKRLALLFSHRTTRVNAPSISTHRSARHA